MEPNLHAKHHGPEVLLGAVYIGQGVCFTPWDLDTTYNYGYFNFWPPFDYLVACVWT